jgi:hypothetical protein
VPRIKYATIKFRQPTLDAIARVNDIIQEYTAQGLTLTLRQLYYQHVARGYIPNNEREYKKLGDVVSDGRMAGMIDWDSIIDRTRYVRDLAHWSGPASIVEACASQFRLDKWKRQPKYCEVWIEKDALIGVIEDVCRQHDVPYLACRGYASASEVWRAGHERFRPRVLGNLRHPHPTRGLVPKACTIFYLGDHDPSGIDMSRDIKARIDEFVTLPLVTVKRLALNMDQIEHYDPPPNPTKLTDSRAAGYVQEYGHECWELDALDPIVIRDMVDGAIAGQINQDLWDLAVAEEDEAKNNLARIADNWHHVLEHLPPRDAGD